jgi:hypothetical protein
MPPLAHDGSRTRQLRAPPRLVRGIISPLRMSRDAANAHQ